MLTPQKIKEALNKKLPGLVSHKKMAPAGRTLTPAMDEKSVKKSSVMLLFYKHEGELNICLIERPAHMKHHARQIALPGGRMEKNETPIETALRETYEEIGVEAEKIEILGALSEVYISVSKFKVLPIIGWMKQTPRFSVNPDEVAAIFHFPLLRYKNIIESVNLETITGKMDVPCIYFNDKIIWGATAMILAEFYDVVDLINR